MDQREFTRLVEQYERFVYTICLQFVHDAQLAEDLTQDTFLSAYTHRDDCPAGSYKPWLARIAANKAKDHLKSAYHRRVQASDTEEGPLAAAPDTAPEPEQLALTREGVDAIRQAVLELKEPYHLVSVLYFLEEQSVDEIARRLDRPPKTVHTQIYRAKLMLQKKLREGGYGNGTVSPRRPSDG